MDLSTLKANATEVKDDTGDSLGGGYILESGTYPMVIELAYMDKSAGGALSMNCVFKHGNQTLKQSFWVQSGDKKGNSNTYVDKRTGETHLLPGLNMANAICTLTIGKELGDLSTTEKTINIYNFEAKAEIPTKVNVLMDLLNQPLTLGVQKRIVDKNVKNDAGEYVPSGETRQENEVSKVFQAKTGLTVAEMRAGETEGKFIHNWEKKWKDVTIDKSSPTSGTPGSMPKGAAPVTPAPAGNSLFPA